MNHSAQYWQRETLRYDRPHPRLVITAQMLRSLPQRRVLDVGCSTAMLSRVLPRDFEYYGCDVTDHASALLPPQHFKQVDLNASADLTAFDNRQIELVHVGGVLEYLRRPDELLASARRLVGSGGRLLTTIINFQSAGYQDSSKHHPAWVYKPTLAELRRAMTAAGWKVTSQRPFFAKSGIRGRVAEVIATSLGPNHPWTQRRAEQFILLAQAC